LYFLTGVSDIEMSVGNINATILKKAETTGKKEEEVTALLTKYK
jgi:hypothetical protein